MILGIIAQGILATAISIEAFSLLPLERLGLAEKTGLLNFVLKIHLRRGLPKRFSRYSKGCKYEPNSHDAAMLAKKKHLNLKAA